MSSFEEDPKEVARIERKSPEVERGLRQFMQLDGPKGTSEEYRAKYDLIFKGADCFRCGGRFLKSDMKALKSAKSVEGPEVEWVDVHCCKICFGPDDIEP